MFRFMGMLRMALAAIGRNRMRATLTTLGISIGIAAVMCTVALGAGSAQTVQQQLANLGENFIWIRAGSVNFHGVRTGSGGTKSLVPEDSQAIVDQVPLIKECSPQVNGRAQIVYRDQNWNTSYQGITPAFLEIRNWKMLQGAAFTDADVAHKAKVCLLGYAVAQTLFGGDNAVGQTVRIGEFPFIVDGVMQSRGSSGAGMDQDDVIFIPYTTAQHNLKGITWVDNITCSTRSAAMIPVAENLITPLLRARHHLRPTDDDDFSLRSPQEYVDLREQSMRTMGLMLSGIAAVSLLVGGIGVMNIMLVSVAERTHEIGLRMAIGAKQHDIRVQFLLEALLLGLIGGGAGVLVGIVGSHALTGLLGWPMAITLGTIVVAVGVAVGSGLVFGYYPASHASTLDPIEALRVE